MKALKENKSKAVFMEGEEQEEETEQYLGYVPPETSETTVAVASLFLIALLAGAGYIGYNTLLADKKPRKGKDRKIN